MRRFVAIITCLALLRATAWAQQEEPAPAPPPPPPETYPQPPPQQQPTYAYPPQQYAPQQYAPRYGMPVGPEQIYRSGRRQRTVGMILTFVGIGLGALGFALLYDAKYNQRNTEVDLFFEDFFGL